MQPTTSSSSATRANTNLAPTPQSQRPASTYPDIEAIIEDTNLSSDERNKRFVTAITTRKMATLRGFVTELPICRDSPSDQSSILSVLAIANRHKSPTEAFTLPFIVDADSTMRSDQIITIITAVTPLQKAICAIVVNFLLSEQFCIAASQITVPKHMVSNILQPLSKTCLNLTKPD